MHHDTRIAISLKNEGYNISQLIEIGSDRHLFNHPGIVG